MSEVTQLLKRLQSGNKAVLDEIIPLVYQELHQIARGYLSRESSGHTLQPTALINEAYLRMVKQPHPEYLSRTHFYGVSARIMRQILVDHARRRQAKKRGADREVTDSDTLEIPTQETVNIIELDLALGRLAATDGRKSRLVEMHFFAGMTGEEIADYEGIPVHTVRRELRMAQAWLHKELMA